MPPLPRCFARGGVREFGCGVTSQLVVMYGAVAATEVVYCIITQAKKARRECDALPTQTTGPKGMGSYTAQWPCVVVVVIGKPTRDRE